jgi:hypothetical protein
MAQIAVLAHSTFTRFELFKKTLESVNTPDFKIYASYTGELDLEKLKYFDKLREQGHEAYYLGWDTSPAVTRNFLIDRIKEKYILKMDDDFVLTDTVKYQDMVKVLLAKPNIGLLGMGVKSAKYESVFIYDTDIINGVLYKRQPSKSDSGNIAGIDFYYCDITPDCWIARREIFPECSYDERYHVSEGLHTDFFLHIKHNTNWRVAYTPDSIMWTFKHDPGVEVPDEVRKNSFYNRKRFRKLNILDNLFEKWQVKEIKKP